MTELTAEVLQQRLKEAFTGKDLTQVTVKEAREVVGKSLGFNHEETEKNLKTNEKNRQMLNDALRIWTGKCSEGGGKVSEENEDENASASPGEGSARKRSRNEVDIAVDQGDYHDDDTLMKRTRIGKANRTPLEFTDEQRKKKQHLIDFVSQHLSPSTLKNLPKTDATVYLEALERRVIEECNLLGIVEENRLPTQDEIVAFEKKKELIKTLDGVDPTNIITGPRTRRPPATAVPTEMTKEAEDENDDDDYEGSEESGSENDDEYDDEEDDGENGGESDKPEDEQYGSDT